MMHLRGVILVALLLTGNARRSIRIDNSHRDAQQMSAEAREALLPGGIGTVLSRGLDPRLSGARRANVALHAASGSEGGRFPPKEDTVSAPAAPSMRSRRELLAAGVTTALSLSSPLAASADEPKYTLGRNYPDDARLMLDNMVTATEMARGTPNMEETVKSTRSQMNDFVAFYRRQPKVAGMPSFSTLYTAINTLSGHYASYGNKYPVPEKRKVRLQQQYKEIERALARGK